MIAVEVRAKDLMTEAFARFLAERGIALVLVDRLKASPTSNRSSSAASAG